MEGKKAFNVWAKKKNWEKINNTDQGIHCKKKSKNFSRIFFIKVEKDLSVLKQIN